MKFCRLLFVCLAAGCAWTAQAARTEFLLDGVAAIVNKHVITVGDVASAVEPLKRRISAAPGTDAYKKEMASLYSLTLEGLVEKFLVLDCDESSKIQIPDWYVDRRVDEIIKDSFAGDRTRFVNVLAGDRQTFEQWRSELKDHILISSIRSMKIDQNVSVSPVEVVEFYEKEKDRFVVPGRVRIRMIVLDRGAGSDDPAALARMLKDRIEKGEDFAALAKEYSSGTYAEKGGDWGWIEPSILRADLREASGALKVGEIGIVEGKEDIYIFRVEERKDLVKQAFKDVQPLVERELKRRRAETEGKAWLDLLRKSAYIKVNETKFE